MFSVQNIVYTEHKEACRNSLESKMKKSRVHEILTSLDLKPHQYRLWLFPSHDHEFEKKEMEICGLYINPPENGIVLCVDEKPAIQAIERIHPSEEMEQARVQRMDSHYKRHGVLNLFRCLQREGWARVWEAFREKESA